MQMVHFCIFFYLKLYFKKHKSQNLCYINIPLFLFSPGKECRAHGMTVSCDKVN